MEAEHDREPPSLGQLFADERERQGLSRTEIAQRLHMSAWQIEALESGDYARLPQGTFLRGFVRNYAKIVGLQPDAMLDHLAEAAPSGPAPRIVVPSQNIRFDPIGDRLANPYVKAAMLAVVALAMGFAVMYWWLFIRPAASGTTLSPALSQGRGSTSQPTPQNLAAAPVPPPDPVTLRQAPTEPLRPDDKAPPAKAPTKAEERKARLEEAAKARTEEAKARTEEAKARNEEAKARTLVPEKVAQVAAAPTPASTTATVPPKAAPGTPTLKLRFKGESWVEVKDRSGKILLSRLNAPGSEAEVSGRPPFAVVIGNAPDVQVLYNDREFPLEPHTRVAVARFTVE